jgi:thymidylate synthase ThyX
MSHPLSEMNRIGRDMKDEVLKVIPTLVKYADRSHYIAETDKAMEEFASGHTKTAEEARGQKSVTLVEYDQEAENKIIASVIYKYSHEPYAQIMKRIRKMNQEEKERVFDEYMKRMGRHDPPMRELEHVYYTFDTLVDYGAFRDIQRHRICTQTNQPLTTANGYDVPQEIIDADLEKQFRAAMESARHAYEKISERFPKEAQYVIPLAYRKRTLFTWNLRELYHFIKLRSGKEGHISYRRVAWELYNEVKRVHPMLAKYIQVDLSEGPSR